ncbi:ATP-dependent RNA helicase SUPV3L1/SUV3 [Litorimonas taeanensis]|uniref:ATP-dependent RNA helicase SUPV3L1/SUV3 n=1 Tax=Litorimonas taeanensis TaxID=568099 RepID=A0A420WCS0_9PROT|nr:helicase-related protein [Litorimonas taeanensis]RKQ68817.1 ATP-dependent RNA helicase SUPV3L1/SUV3 [Litorimonas taeanensis]
MPSPLNPATVTAVLGPTNTGKTHYAVERMLARSSGVIGLPLRLLAREIYDRIVALKGAAQCALITGEEKILPKTARFFVCTVEAMPVDRNFAFLAVDEVQMMANPERGHIFTDRVLHARGMEETLFLGAETARSVLKTLIPKIRVEHRERFSTLVYDGPKKLTRLPKRSVIVAFSASEVYALAELIRRYRGGAAVVMGGLSPRTRNAQAEMFQNGDVDFLIATDAVGMGLNLDTDHVAFAGLSKYDGRRKRYLTPMEAGQIAGRAGRFRNDGTFGTTGDCPAMDDEFIKRIEDHDFEPLEYVEWRNSDLDFSSLNALTETLHAPRPTSRLRRIKGAEDEAALERFMAIDEIASGIKVPAQVRQLWDICQIPDFRNLTIDTHFKLLQDIYGILVKGGGTLSTDFMMGRINRLDDISGGVHQLSSRLAHIRTWTYCASKSNWMPKSERLGGKTLANYAREVEDRLSDALHERLIARFVDKRTSKLLKGIGADAYMSATIKDNGEVYVDDLLIGQLEGLTFKADASGSGLEAKALDAAAAKAVAPEIDRRLTSLCGGTHAIFTLSDKGEILWGGMTVGRIAPSGSIFTPDAEVLSSDLGSPALKSLASDRMREFLRAEVATHLAPLKALKDFKDKEEALPDAKGFAYILLEGHGSLERREHLKTIQNLEQDARRQLRELGVQFGFYNVYMPDMLKPKPARLLSLLNAYGAGGDKNPFIPFAGMTSLANDGDMKSDNFGKDALALAGYRAVGSRIVRLDILNRLSLMIRQAQEQFSKIPGSDTRGRPFQIMQEMLSLIGGTYEDMQNVLNALSYKSEIREDLPAPANAAETATAETSTEDSLTKGTPEEKPKTEETSATDAAEITSAEGAGAENQTASTPATPPAKSFVSKKSKKASDLTLYNNRVQNEDGTTTEVINKEVWLIPARGQKGFNPKSQGGRRNTSRDKFKGRNNNQRHAAKTGANRSLSQGKGKASIKNSPFAALAALQIDSGDKKKDDKS